MSPQEGGSSSSRRSPPKPTAIEDYDSDDVDPVANYSREQALFSEDPLDDDTSNVVSFKRKQKQPAGSEDMVDLAVAVLHRFSIILPEDCRRDKRLTGRTAPLIKSLIQRFALYTLLV